MSDDEAIRTPSARPARPARGDRGWLQRWQRQGRDAAAYNNVRDDNDRDGDARTCCAAGVARERSAFGLRALDNRLPAWATRSTRGPALATLRRSAPTAGSGAFAAAREQTRDHVGQARSLLHEGDRGSEKHSARAAPTAAASRSGAQSDERATIELRDSVRQPFRRLAGARLGLPNCARAGHCRPAFARPANAAADERKPPPKAEPSTVTLGHSQRMTALGPASARRSASPGAGRAVTQQAVADFFTRRPAAGERGATDDLPDVDPYPPLASDSALAGIRSLLGREASGIRSVQAVFAFTRPAAFCPATRLSGRAAPVSTRRSRRLSLTACRCSWPDLDVAA